MIIEKYIRIKHINSLKIQHYFFLDIEMFEESSFHIMGDSITFLSGDLTEKINKKTITTVDRITIITLLSEILFMFYLTR